MLFDASTTYAPGEPRGAVGYGDYQHVGRLGHYDLASLKPPNVVIGILGLALLAFLVHKYGGRR